MYEKDSSKDVGFTNVIDKDAFGAPPFRRFCLFYFIILSIISTCASVYLFYTLIARKFFKLHFHGFVCHLAVMYIIFGVFICKHNCTSSYSKQTGSGHWARPIVSLSRLSGNVKDYFTNDSDVPRNAIRSSFLF
jgi:hypothetical protein